MEKICFLLRVRPDAVHEYIERHEHAWPELIDALDDSGYRNYSIFADPSGLLVGYLETHDYAATIAQMKRHAVAERWSIYMDELFLPVDDDHPVGSLRILRKGFDLDEHLQRSTTRS